MYKTALILAADESKNMNSKLPKVMHKICGKQMIKHVFDAVNTLCDDKPIIVLDEKTKCVEELLVDKAIFVKKENYNNDVQQLLKDKDGYVLVISGDMPFIKAQTIEKLFEKTAKNDYSAFELVANSDRRNINKEYTSVYCFNIKDLLYALSKTDKDATLNDMLFCLHSLNKKVGTSTFEDDNEAIKIIDRICLSKAEAQMRKRINNELMLSGVTLIDPENTYIEASVKIGQDTIIYPGNVIEGNTVIGEDTVIYSGSRIVDSYIGNACEITSSVILEAKIGNNTKVGPNAYLRKGTDVGDNVRIGDFVEIKNARIGNGTKVSHLTYVGDATVGENCNMGCGTVFVNYDGKNKHHSVVGDHVFIGCNSNIIAPVKIGNNAFIAAATTVTKDVEENDLSIGRSRQENKKGWVLNYKNW